MSNHKESKPKYNSEITEEDKNTLGDRGVRRDNGDDRMLQNRKQRLDFTGKDLDVPGRTSNNVKNLKDEENKFYSQGSESKRGLEEPERANAPRNEND
ncbi:hypothetical protein B0O79_1343 [Flavobacteriaceae bacterium MAR_2009_75]|nr:hypothetical protein B0O79_1343 [Flavobacteriaceae bacterium MAR_2009_75]